MNITAASTAVMTATPVDATTAGTLIVRTTLPPIVISRSDVDCNTPDFLQALTDNGRPTHSNEYCRYEIRKNSRGEAVIYHTSFLIPRETDPGTIDEFDRSFLYWKSRTLYEEYCRRQWWIRHSLRGSEDPMCDNCRDSGFEFDQCPAWKTKTAFVHADKNNDWLFDAKFDMESFEKLCAAVLTMEAAGQVIDQPWASHAAGTSAKALEASEVSRKLFERPRYEPELDLPPFIRRDFEFTNRRSRYKKVASLHKHNVLHRAVFSGNIFAEGLDNAKRTYPAQVVKPGSSRFHFFKATHKQPVSHPPPSYRAEKFKYAQ